MIYSSCISSPIGNILISSNGESITQIDFTEKEWNENTCQVIENCIQQLNEYFEGKRTQFDIPLNPLGTLFQQNVWKELVKIPFGETISYQMMAEKLGDSKLVRAVGTANGKNPIAIIIPCHRVIGQGGKLTGYAGGIWRKRWLLQHEIKHNSKRKTLF